MVIDLDPSIKCCLFNKYENFVRKRANSQSGVDRTYFSASRNRIKISHLLSSIRGNIRYYLWRGDQSATLGVTTRPTNQSLSIAASALVIQGCQGATRMPVCTM